MRSCDREVKGRIRGWYMARLLLVDGGTCSLKAMRGFQSTCGASDAILLSGT